MITNHRFIRALGLAFAVSISLFFVGCASVPSPEVMKAETTGYKLPALPSDGKAMVYVVRPSPLGTLIRFNVFINEEKPEAEMGCAMSEMHKAAAHAADDHKSVELRNNMAGA